MAQAVAPSSVEANIQGDVSGQVAVGSYIVQVGSVHGGVVNIAAPAEQPVPRARPAPVLLRPRPFPNMVGRKSEVESASSSLRSGQSVELFGEPGMGKTAILRQVSHQSLTDFFPDGVVYLSALHKSDGDLSQLIYDAFYECDIPFKPNDSQFRHSLQSKQALIILDDVELDRDSLETLTNAVASSTFATAASVRKQWGEVRALAVRGLQVDDGIALLEQELGEPLPPEQVEEARTLCEAVKGHPLRIRQAASMIVEDGRSLADVAREAQGAPPAQAVTAPILAAQPDPQRQMIETLAALGGATIGVDHLAALAQIANAQAVIASLQQNQVAQAHSPRYNLTGSLAETVTETWDLTGARKRALDYFITWCESHQDEPGVIAKEADAICQIIQWAIREGQWESALRLCRAVEDALALDKTWDAWARTIQWSFEAATALEDRSEEARALHQRGTRALCLEDRATARLALSRALQLRGVIGDAAGIAVTSHNLRILDTPPVTTAVVRYRPTKKPKLPIKGFLWPFLFMALGTCLALAARGPATRLLSGFARQTGSKDAPPRVLALSSITLIQPIHTTGRAAIALKNGGSQSSTIDSLDLQGPNRFEFSLPSIRALKSPVVPAHGELLLPFEFTPSAPGERKATVRIKYDRGTHEQTFDLLGVGVAAEPRPRLAVTPNRVEFPSQTVGSTSQRKSATLRNSGDKPLRLNTISIVGTDPSDFLLDPDAGGTSMIDPHTSKQVSFSFMPILPGKKTARLVAIDETGLEVASIGLVGKGISNPVSEAPAFFPTTRQAGKLSVTPKNLFFGQQAVGTESPPKTMTVSNTGDAPMTIKSISFGGPFAKDFQFVDKPPTEYRLNPGESIGVPIKCVPQTETSGVRRAMIRIETDIPNRLDSFLLNR